MMRILGKLMDHVRLVSRMAKATDTDLVAAHQAGDLTQDEWADMVQTCRTCTWDGRCQDWLDTHDHADQAPAPCLNRARFEALNTAATDTPTAKDTV